MLVEKHPENISNKRVAIGETVKIMTNGQTGQVVGYENGQWIVEVNGVSVRVVESQLQVREILYG